VSEGPESSALGLSSARLVAGLSLIAAVIVLMFVDAYSVEFKMDPIELGLMLGSGMLLLGVEAAKALLR
jgi:hypothetical protein